MMTDFNELPQGKYGRHGFFSGDWTAAHEKFLREHQFPMATIEGAWSNLSFLQAASESIRWLRIANKNKKIDGIDCLKRLDTLIIGFEPKNEHDLHMLPELVDLEVVSKNAGKFLSIKNLERLRVIGAQDICFECSDSSIEDLSLIRPACADFSGLGALLGLKKLEIYGARYLEDIEFVGNFNGLEVVSFESCKSLKNVNKLLRLKSIRKVSIVNCPVTDMSGFVDGCNLEFLHIGGGPVYIKWDELFGVMSLRRVVVHVREDISSTEAILSSAKLKGRSFDKFSAVGKKDKTIDILLTA